MITIKQAIAIPMMINNLADCHKKFRQQSQLPLAKEAIRIMADGSQLIAKIQEDIEVTPEEVNAFLDKGKEILDILYPSSV